MSAQFYKLFWVTKSSDGTDITELSKISGRQMILLTAAELTSVLNYTSWQWFMYDNLQTKAGVSAMLYRDAQENRWNQVQQIWMVTKLQAVKKWNDDSLMTTAIRYGNEK